MRNQRLILSFSLAVMLIILPRASAHAQTNGPQKTMNSVVPPAEPGNQTLTLMHAMFPYDFPDTNILVDETFADLYQPGKKWDSDAREGLRLFDDEELDQATSHLQRAIAAGCKDAVVLFAYGCCRLNEGDKAQFQSYLKKATTSDLSAWRLRRLKWRCFQGLGWLEAIEGNWDSAYDYYRSGLKDFIKDTESNRANLDFEWLRDAPRPASGGPDWYAYLDLSNSATALEMAAQYLSESTMDPKWASDVRLGTMLYWCVRLRPWQTDLFPTVEPIMTSRLASSITAGCDNPVVLSIYATMRSEVDLTGAAQPLLERAEKMFALQKSHHLERYYLLVRLGETSERRKDYQTALDRYRLAREVFVAARGPDISPYVIEQKIEKVDALFKKAQEERQTREDALANIEQGPGDVNSLIELIRKSLAANDVNQALAYSNDALRQYPDSPAVLAAHMQVLVTTGKHESLLNVCRTALPLAIEKGDGDSTAEMLHHLWLISKQGRYTSKEAFAERLNLVQPILLADQALRTFPKHPRVVLEYFPLFDRLQNKYLFPGYAPADAPRASFVTHAVPAIELSRQEEHWETLAGLLTLYFERIPWPGDYGISRTGFTDAILVKTTGLPPRPPEERARYWKEHSEDIKSWLTSAQAWVDKRWREDHPERFPEWMAEAAVQLKSKKDLTTAFRMMNEMCQYPRDAEHFMKLKVGMDRFRKEALNAGMSKNDLYAAEKDFLTRFADEWSRGKGDDTDMALLKTHMPDRHSRWVAPMSRYMDTDLATSRQMALGGQVPDSQYMYGPSAPVLLPKVSMPVAKREQRSGLVLEGDSHSKYDSYSYTDALNDLHESVKRGYARGVIESRDDASTAKALRGLRDVYDDLVGAGLHEERFTEVLEHAEWFHGWAMRNLLATRMASTPQLPDRPDKPSDDAKSAPSGLVARRDGTGTSSATSSMDTNTRDIATEANVVAGPATWLTTTQGEAQETRPIEPLKLDEIQRMLDKDTAILYCHLTAQSFVGATGFVALVTDDNMYMHGSLDLNVNAGRIPRLKHRPQKGEGFHKKCAYLHELLRDLQSKPPSETVDGDLEYYLRQLYDYLIAPIEENLSASELIIVPSDDLFSIPWGLLLDKDGRYLCEKVAISYVPSATVLQFCRNRHAPLGNSALVFANPDLADPNYTLKFAEQESIAVKACYPKTDSYLGALATETGLLEGVASADIIHLACHAIRNKIDPMASYLALARDAENDGRLTASEIMNLRTSAQLVVLSACESGRGDVPTSQQEIVGMPRAWMVAGAPSVLVSLWKVDDRATSELMGEFYKNLKAMSRSQALQRAQLTLMKKYQNPYYWGAFVLYGDYR